MNKNKIIKMSIIGFFVISILGTLLHFFYEFTGNNPIIGAFSAVNESVWEHLKIAVIPCFLWAIVEFKLLKNNNSLWFSLLIKIITIMLIITTVFYFYTSITNKSILLIDISTFYISILLAQILSCYILIKNNTPKKVETFSKIMSLIILFSFVIFTYITPKLEIFKDSTNDTYGILQNIK